MNFAGRVVVITGGASGIGFGAAQLFAKQGAQVAIIDQDAEQGMAARDHLVSEGVGGQSEFYLADISVEGQVENVCGAIERRFGRVNHLVNSAGTLLVKALQDTTSDEWDRVMNVNVKSVFLMCKHLFPLLTSASPASIVNVGSISSFVGQKLTPIYVASKGAVALLSKSVALDFAQYGIRVNCVCPGVTDTPMFQRHVRESEDPQRTIRERQNRVPLNRLLSPLDVAHAIVFLCSDEAAGITGTTLVVDAGYLAAAEWSNT